MLIVALSYLVSHAIIELGYGFSASFCCADLLVLEFFSVSRLPALSSVYLEFISIAQQEIALGEADKFEYSLDSKQNPAFIPLLAFSNPITNHSCCQSHGT